MSGLLLRIVLAVTLVPLATISPAKCQEKPPLVTPSACASGSIRTASGPPAASARRPAAIQMLRGVRVGAAIPVIHTVLYG